MQWILYNKLNMWECTQTLVIYAVPQEVAIRPPLMSPPAWSISFFHIQQGLWYLYPFENAPFSHYQLEWGSEMPLFRVY